VIVGAPSENRKLKGAASRNVLKTLESLTVGGLREDAWQGNEREKYEGVRRIITC